MAIDYLVDLPCRVKEKLPFERLVPLVKLKVSLDQIIKDLKKRGETIDKIKDIKIRIQLRNEKGLVEEREIKIEEALKITKILEELKQFCRSCPLGYIPFGCYGVINYPISALAEKWIAEIAKNAAIEGGQRTILLKTIVEDKVKGERVALMRASKDTKFFELKEPIEVIPGIINTNQIFEVLFGMGLRRFGKWYQWMILNFVDAITISKNTPEEKEKQRWFRWQFFIKNLVKETDVWIRFKLKEEVTDDKSIYQLKWYFRALFTAFCLKKDIIIDW